MTTTRRPFPHSGTLASILALACAAIMAAIGLRPLAAPPAATPGAGTTPGAGAFKDVTEEMGLTNFQKLKGEFPPCPADDDHHYFHWPFNLCVGDFNGDGFPDLFCGQHGEPAQGDSHLMILDPKTQKFTLHRGDKIITATPRQGRGAYISGVVDANDDGVLDIVLSDGDTSGSILLNASKGGQPAFEKMAFGSPSGLAFSDLNKTGGLDTVVSSSDKLPVYRGINTEKKNLIDTGIQVFGNRHGNVILADFNGDGYDDILYTEAGAAVSGKQTDRKNRLRLFLNQGNWKFQEITAEAGLGKSCTGNIAVGDLNNDGALDIIAMGTENSDQPDGNVKVYLNDGAAHFTDSTAKTPMKLPLRNRRKWGWEMDLRYNMVLADLDNDGFLDLATSAEYGFYRNKGDGTFEEFTLIKPNSTGNGIVCAADFNDDGLLDLAMLASDEVPVRIFRNQTPPDAAPGAANRYLKLQLRQKDKNIFAIGAKIHAYKPGMMGEPKGQLAMRELMANAMNLVDFAPIHLGVGAHDKVDLRVVFPNGKVVEKKDVATNQTLKIQDSEATKAIEFKVKEFKPLVNDAPPNK